MQEIKQLPLTKDGFLFIHTPFCGTCHVARSFLQKIETTHKEEIFLEMNGSLFPEFMQENKIESVPCLLIVKDGEIKEKIYTFHSVANIYHYVFEYKPELFSR
ncbi:thioredoxin family protein [Pseudogracilibacillus sp. SO10305]|uniref:thioredoxin family protein n=1 Tax=Pseudogracilibacillus sp. SO10305 TaxID=3098292 RepID=UPI00300DC256